MILTDGIHLMTDGNISELHDFAIGKLGFSRGWFQDDKNHPHYDLTTYRVFERAVKLGAKEVSPKELVLRCSKRYNK